MELKTFYISGKIELIKIKDITIPLINREEILKESIVKMSANIKRNGLIEPVFLRRDIENPKKYVLISGTLRLLSSELLGAEKIPAIVFSLSETEAEMIYLLKKKSHRKISIFEKANILFGVLKSGRIKPFEAADILNITKEELEKTLKVLEIESETKKVIINRKLDDEFVFSFLDFEKEKREKIINHILVKDFYNDRAKEYLLEQKGEKKRVENKKTLNNDILISNSIENLSKSLNKSGITAFCRKNEDLLKTEYILEVLK